MQRRYEVPPNGELIIRLPICDFAGEPTAPLSITLRPADGDIARTAELFGADLIPNIPVTFEAGAQCAVFSPTGCTLVAEGSLQDLNGLFIDTIAAGAHKSLLEVNFALEMQRRRAREEEGRPGPCVMVCSAASDVGKSTIARTLANYGVRLGYHPLFLDMDPANPSLGMPGCISVFNLQYPIGDDNGAQFIPGQHVFVGPEANKEMLKTGMGNAMALTEHRWAQGNRIRLGGAFIDYPTVDVQDEESMEQLRLAIEQCGVDTLVIVGTSGLKHALIARFDASNARATGRSVLTLGGGQEVALVVVEALHGAVRRNRIAKEAMLRRYWDRYFYGTLSVPLRPTEMTVQAQAVWILRIIPSGDDKALQTMMSLDHAGEEAEMTVMTLNPAGLAPGTLLALSDSCFEVCEWDDPYHADATYANVAEEEVFSNLRASRRVLGMVRVVSATSTSLTLLSPCGVLPQPRGCCFVVLGED